MSDLGINAAKAYMSTAQALSGAGIGGMGGAGGIGGHGGAMAPGLASCSTPPSARSAMRVRRPRATPSPTRRMGKDGPCRCHVTAVAAAEATLETVVAVHDEVIKAYQDIMRMPI